LVPDQPPDALQEVMLLDDQVSVEDWPGVIVLGEAESDTLGPVLPPYGFTFPSMLPYMNGRSGQFAYRPLKQPPSWGS
jgi:hypothetical protein